ncbi:thiol reductant ABC exporter subunit CydC [Mangrovihabitans endophyticus]|uniref:ATP-binding cassette, subfamily C, CydCD n=1 Tax=Mangrovihabitans endophyticus TaxID=1751298 RepID=A0A8J3C7I4_9ACTN|nr:thiol reductant ABC exporter subunit CydC [Mangrovihabitans endophyticus]GGL17103.1 hypothetical protein GCM10012284_59620 [Mangrovihabitans endophyticus]
MSGGSGPAGRPAGSNRPLDPRLLRHARTSRAGIAALALIGAAQAGAAVLLAAGLTTAVTGARTPAVAMLAGAYAARAALAWTEQVVAQRTAARVTDELRRAAMAAVLRHGPAWTERFGTGRLTAVLTRGLDALRPWFTGYLPALALGVLLPPLVIVVMAVVDPPSAVIALLTLPLVPVLGALIGTATRARAQARWAADARVAGHFLDAVRGLATLRLYGRAHRQAAVVAEMTDRHRDATMRVLRVAFLSSTALELLGTLAVGLIAVEAGLRVAAGTLALAPALLVILLAPEAYRPLREMAARFHAAADAGAMIADVDEILRPVPSPDRTAAGSRVAMPGGVARVTAIGLRVRHPGAAADALALDRLDAAAGEIVALRGPSGAGKTTALRVLAGIQRADAGRVTIAGPSPLYLSQRPVLPHARTVAEAAGRLDAGADPADVSPESDRRVRAVLRGAGLDGELAPGVPLGEHGQGVSAGQRQRLAVAAVLDESRRTPVTLLLDEPTAHLDADAERRVVGDLRAAADRGCAVVVAAHRPALLAAADRVVDVRPPAVAVRAHGPERAHGPAGADGPERAVRADFPADAAARTDPASAAGARAPLAGAVAAGAASWLAGILLTGAAAWLLVRAADRPPVLALSTAVVLVRGSAVARPLLRYVERLAAHRAAFARLSVWRSGVYRALVPLVPGARPHRRGELLTRVADDVDARADGLLRGWLPAGAAVGTFAVAGVAAVLVLPAAAAPLAAGLLVAGVAAPAITVRQVARDEAATGAARHRLRDAVVETVDGVEELAARAARHDPVRAPSPGPAAAAIPADPVLAVPDRRSRALSRMQARAARAAGLGAAVGHAGWGAAVILTAVLADAADLSAPWAAVLLLAAGAAGEPVAVLTDAAEARRRGALARERLTALAGSAPPGAGPNPGPAGPGAAGPGAAGPGAAGPGAAGPGAAGDAEPGRVHADGPAVTVRGLVAGWRPDGPAALRGLDLDLAAGEHVAVLGRSGSGKSTLAAVLTGFLPPRAGTVVVRAAPGTGDRHAGIRAGLVSDDADHVFATRVRENLLLARPGATDADLHQVLARVGLAGWLSGLPDNLDTWLGSGGGTLSGGQRRRLATARALLADPALLILDEPTEGLDEAAAGALMADLLGAARGRTVLLLTHRRDGLDLVDRILHVENGQLRPARAAASRTPSYEPRHEPTRP